MGTDTIKRPRPGARPIVLKLYPDHDYCCLEDPRYDRFTECRFENVELLNGELTNHMVMVTRMEGPVGIKGPPGEPAPVLVRTKRLSGMEDPCAK